LTAGVAEVISYYNMFAPGMSVGVAVSGGADSVCLAEVLVELAPRWNLKLRVLHLDHGLRGEESRADARFVAALAAQLGLPFELREADVAAEPGNLEQAARRARRRFFLEAIASGRVDRVALGHTRDDQAETVLDRFLRGAGTAGLAGMRPVSRDGLVRPLLATSRAEVVGYLRARGLQWREDSSNRDPRFRRNRIRHELLPALAADWNPALAGTLAGVARVAADEEEYWDGILEPLAAELFRREPPAVVVDCGRLGALPRALARRLIRRAIEMVKGDLRSIDVGHVETIFGLVANPEGRGRAQAPGVDAMRSFEWLRLAPAGAHARPEYLIPVTGPGRYPVPGGEVEVPTGFDGPLELRNWRPGDAYRPAGASRERKIKEMFQDARVPLWERSGWPVLASGGRVVWAAGFGPAADCAQNWNPPPCLCRLNK
jgi:tRNA(Ile)-lysidine synthase